MAAATNQDEVPEILRAVTMVKERLGVRTVLGAVSYTHLSPYRDQMRANLAEALGVPVENVGVKATTTEHLGFEGREEGISATAVCLLCRCR